MKKYFSSERIGRLSDRVSAQDAGRVALALSVSALVTTALKLTGHNKKTPLQTAEPFKPLDLTVPNEIIVLTSPDISTFSAEPMLPAETGRDSIDVV